MVEQVLTQPQDDEIGTASVHLDANARDFVPRPAPLHDGGGHEDDYKTPLVVRLTCLNRRLSLMGRSISFWLDSSSLTDSSVLAACFAL